MDFGELKNDEDFVKKMTDLSQIIDKIDQNVDTACDFTEYESLSNEEKVKHDLYMVYAANSLLWVYSKLQGNDKIQDAVKDELSRVRQAMLREKQIEDHKLRPVLDKAAANRFIKHGLHDSDNQSLKDQNKDTVNNRKRKLDK